MEQTVRIKNVVQRVLKTLGFELHRTDGRGTLGGALSHLSEKGFRPDYVIDGGASDGRWTRFARKYFPNAQYTLVEPLSEHLPALRSMTEARIVPAALSSTAGKAVFHVTSEFNSSLVPRAGTERTVDTVTLDSLLENSSRTLVKLDLEGGELEVLRASQSLSGVGAVIVECAFARLPEYCALMREKGHVVHEIFDLNYDRTSGDMSQVDILFVPAQSSLRSVK